MSQNVTPTDPPVTMIKGSLPQSRFILCEGDVIASTRILEEDLIQAVFDGLSEEDESDNDEDNEIYAFLGAPTVWRADLMSANLAEDEGEDQEEQEDQFDRADLMAGCLNIAGGDQEHEEVSSTPLVASTTGSSNANPDTNVIENDLSDREVLAAYTVRIKL